jgi:hypothetical protein
MSSKLIPPPPDSEKPQKSAWTLVLAGLAFLFVLVALSFLTLGYFAPVIFLGLGVFALIGAQYLVWGWLFERIYRNGKEHSDD